MKSTLRSPKIKSLPSTQVIALQNFYKQKKLTNCLEILETRGLQGDAAIFMLSNLGGVSTETCKISSHMKGSV
jgi:hypothetical protein